MAEERLDELGGASMTVINLADHLLPAVSPPEVAILGITRTEVAPVWYGEAFQTVQMVPLDLSYDHRAFNGADAARFLSYYAGLLKEPWRMKM